jgi:hypothetical protein
MSEPTNEPIELEHQFHDEDGNLQWKTTSFTGERLDSYEEAHAAFTLYRWLDKGFLTYVEDFKHDLKTVYPDPDFGKGYTAEEVAEQWPPFASTVGITPKHDTDFDEPYS